MKPDADILQQQFDFPGPVQTIEALGSGHIHDTYIVTCGDPASTRWVLQKFNNQVFKNPSEVASNIWMVLEHCARSVSNTSLQPLRVFKTKDGKFMYRSEQGAYWRVFNYIEGSESFDRVTHPDQAYGAAHAFGSFIGLLSGLNPEKLHTTITDFHNINQRFQQLENAVKADRVGRVNLQQEEITFAFHRGQQVKEYYRQTDDETIPLRVTHNDTKINNVLFKKGTTTAICVLDLDTVMPGLLLYDFGDMARTFCNNSDENEKADNVFFRTNIFEVLCQGFFNSFKTPLEQAETDSLKFGPWWMTYIMGIRFLTDFLSGDIYYKVSFPNQNLVRARNQFKLLTDIENKQVEINQIIDHRKTTL